MLFGGLANTIFNGLFNIISSMMHFVMMPINLIIQNVLPDVQSALNAMNGYLNKVGEFLSFGLSYFGFYTELIDVSVLIIGAIMTIPLLVHSLKLILRWYRILMP